MQVVSIFKYSPDEKLLRLFRIVWLRGIVGDGRGYSAKFSVSVEKHFPFLCFHYSRAYGGIFV